MGILGGSQPVARYCPHPGQPRQRKFAGEKKKKKRPQFKGLNGRMHTEMLNGYPHGNRVETNIKGVFMGEHAHPYVYD